MNDIVTIFMSVDPGDSIIGNVLTAAAEGKLLSPDDFSHYELEEALEWLTNLRLERMGTRMERQDLLSVLTASLAALPGA